MVAAACGWMEITCGSGIGPPGRLWWADLTLCGLGRRNPARAEARGSDGSQVDGTGARAEYTDLACLEPAGQHLSHVLRGLDGVHLALG
ncbi:MAG: hypothetical protein ACYS7M_11770, partial [Planctomycetota bacterium]|jgi:hypothetical protein